MPDPDNPFPPGEHADETVKEPGGHCGTGEHAGHAANSGFWPSGPRAGPLEGYFFAPDDDPERFWPLAPRPQDELPANPGRSGPGEPGAEPPFKELAQPWDLQETSEPRGVGRDVELGPDAAPEQRRPVAPGSGTFAHAAGGQVPPRLAGRLPAARRGPARHARPARNPRRLGAFPALAAALLIAAAIPLGILFATALAHHQTTLRIVPVSASQTTVFTAIAGPGCPAATGATAVPYQAPNGDSWHWGIASGSTPCGRRFTYSYLAMVPGNPGEWRDHYAWTFRTRLNNPSCRFSLYIPSAPEANSDSYYWFSAGTGNPLDRIGDFTLDQARYQGRWVTEGPFTFAGGTVLVEATDRGEGPLTAAVAVGPARLSCTGQ